MIVFLDASALIKLYREEPGTATMRSLVGSTELAGSCFISDHVGLEVVVRLHKLIRTSRGRTRRAFAEARSRFARDRHEHLNEVAVSPRIISRAEALASAFPGSGAGTLDLLHAASALHVQQVLPSGPLTFVASDRKLKHLAAAAGLRIFDPERDALAALAAPYS